MSTEGGNASTPLAGIERVALGVLCLSLGVRLHNLWLLPTLRGYDAVGHVQNIAALYDGAFPEPTSWAGFHPPLYHAFCALLWRVAPSSFPSDVLFRAVSLAASIVTLVLVFQMLRWVCGRRAALVAVTVAACSPVLLIASTTIGNETTCMLFVTAALVGVSAPSRSTRDAVVGGVVAGLAGLSKLTGLLVLPVVALFQLRSLRAPSAREIATAALTLGIGLLVVSPHFARLMLRTDASPLAMISGGALSPDAADEMSRQPPGVRTLHDYLMWPAATFTAPAATDPDLERSVTALLYATLYADPHGQYLPDPARTAPTLGRMGALLGLVPSGLAALGLGVLLRAWRTHSWAQPGLCFLALLVAAFLFQTWSVPRVSAVKGSYLLSAILPATACLAVGLARLRGTLAVATEVFLVVASLAYTASYWLGAWV